MRRAPASFPNGDATVVLGSTFAMAARVRSRADAQSGLTCLVAGDASSASVSRSMTMVTWSIRSVMS